MTTHMSRAHFEAVVDRVLEELPDWVHERIDNLVIVVEDWPTPEQDPSGEDPRHLRRRFPGRTWRRRWGALPDQITIFRIPHLRLGLEGPQLEEEIRRTVLHELAHHLGIDDARLHELGWD